ncbi:MAG: hypothetical protein KDB23_33430 [Planctomycetales bacterium]|nr:hypothetical protein [Planctomycetales bacterium]
MRNYNLEMADIEFVRFLRTIRATGARLGQQPFPEPPFIEVDVRQIFDFFLRNHGDARERELWSSLRSKLIDRRFGCASQILVQEGKWLDILAANA